MLTEIGVDVHGGSECLSCVLLNEDITGLEDGEATEEAGIVAMEITAGVEGFTDLRENSTNDRFPTVAEPTTSKGKAEHPVKSIKSNYSTCWDICDGSLRAEVSGLPTSMGCL